VEKVTAACRPRPHGASPKSVKQMAHAVGPSVAWLGLPAMRSRTVCCRMPPAQEAAMSASCARAGIYESGISLRPASGSQSNLPYLVVRGCGVRPALCTRSGVLGPATRLGNMSASATS
jgi:hypothetical protein